MGFIIFLLFMALALSLFLSLLRRGKAGLRSRIVRAVVVIFSVSVFSYWFFERSVTGFVQDSLAVQIINRLPQPIDFYLIKKNNPKQETLFSTRHIGKIRPDYYRIEYLPMEDSDEFWLAGYIGKKNLVYFSQHAVPNKNMDQIIEIQNYVNQSLKLSDRAKKEINALHSHNISLSIWITLCLLLLFMNFVLLFKKVLNLLFNF